METVQVSLKREVFDRLKTLAEPLVDDTSSVIERLINHWESAPPITSTGSSVCSEPIPTIWRSARGEKFLVGTQLRANYLKHSFEASVTADGIVFGGRTYDNPSSAGIAAKESVGTMGKAASTNGWEFWEMQDSKTKRWISIDVLRASNAG